jgi:hypothetical protein
MLMDMQVLAERRQVADASEKRDLNELATLAARFASLTHKRVVADAQEDEDHNELREIARAMCRLLEMSEAPVGAGAS